MGFEILYGTSRRVYGFMRCMLSFLGGERTRQRRQALLLAGVNNELCEQLVDEDTVNTNKTTR